MLQPIMQQMLGKGIFWLHIMPPSAHDSFPLFPLVLASIKQIKSSKNQIRCCAEHAPLQADWSSLTSPTEAGQIYEAKKVSEPSFMLELYLLCTGLVKMSIKTN